MKASDPMSVLNSEILWGDVPAYIKEEVPDWVNRHKHGYGKKTSIVPQVIGIDGWQANHGILCCPETEEFLYKTYTPLTVQYPKGTFPILERVLDDFRIDKIRGLRNKAVYILEKVMQNTFLHDSFAPLCAQYWTGDVGARGLYDEELFLTGGGSCHEQTKIFMRFCHILGIPARMIFLQYADNTYHTIAEFYASGTWSMVDVTRACAYPGPDGKLLSAIELHRPEKKYRESYAKANMACHKRLISLSDLELVGRLYMMIQNRKERESKIKEHASRIRAELRKMNNKSIQMKKLGAFAVVNYPLPR